jgi:hypothetical protein
MWREGDGHPGRRDGVAAVELVPGDLAVVTPAAAFPADGIIVAGASR